MKGYNLLVVFTHILLIVILNQTLQLKEIERGQDQTSSVIMCYTPGLENKFIYRPISFTINAVWKQYILIHIKTSTISTESDNNNIVQIRLICV